MAKRSSVKRMARRKAQNYRPRTKGLLGRSVTTRDRKRTAERPGKRVSASGRVYYERRRNRADMNPVTGL
ncbi:MAG: hypothetical protein ABIN58_11575 [candidate division WOR-3 bacterium]